MGNLARYHGEVHDTKPSPTTAFAKGSLESIKSLCLSALFAVAASSVAAIPIDPNSAHPSDNSGTPISGTNLADALDGNLATAYVTRIDDTNALGHGVRFDFDVSGFTNISAFTIDMMVTYASDNPAFQSLRLGAGRFADFLTTNTPIGQMTGLSVTATPAGAGATDLDAYFSIDPDIISVWVQTSLGVGPGSFTQIAFHEIDADIVADRVVPGVPLPAGLPLLLTAFGGLALLRRRRG